MDSIAPDRDIRFDFGYLDRFYVPIPNTVKIRLKGDCVGGVASCAILFAHIFLAFAESSLSIKEQWQNVLRKVIIGLRK